MSLDLDEVAHHESPQQDLRCLHIQFFFVSGTYKEFKYWQKPPHPDLHRLPSSL